MKTGILVLNNKIIYKVEAETDHAIRSKLMEFKFVHYPNLNCSVRSTKDEFRMKLIESDRQSEARDRTRSINELNNLYFYINSIRVSRRRFYNSLIKRSNNPVQDFNDIVLSGKIVKIGWRTYKSDFASIN